MTIINYQGHFKEQVAVLLPITLNVVDHPRSKLLLLDTCVYSSYKWLFPHQPLFISKIKKKISESAIVLKTSLWWKT